MENALNPAVLHLFSAWLLRPARFPSKMLLLLANAVLHGIIIWRFGIKGNEPPAVFGVLYAGLSLAVFLGWAHAPLAALIVTTVGLVGLAANFKKLQHDTTVEKFVFVVGAATVACVAYPFLVR